MITVADPIVRFHDLIVRPNLVDFEMREGSAAWERSRETFSSKVLGPHFEDLARQWTLRYGRERGLDDIGQVGTTTVPCREHRGHEVDVVALGRESRARDKRAARITLLGEAKATNKSRTTADLRRLEHIRDVLCAQAGTRRAVRSPCMRAVNPPRSGRGGEGGAGAARGDDRDVRRHAGPGTSHRPAPPPVSATFPAGHPQPQRGNAVSLPSGIGTQRTVEA